jgi:hypothetical protein
MVNKKKPGVIGKTKRGMEFFLEAMKLMQAFLTAPDDDAATAVVDTMWEFRDKIWGEIGNKLAEQHPEQEVAHAG